MGWLLTLSGAPAPAGPVQVLLLGRGWKPGHTGAVLAPGGAGAPGGR